MRCEKDAEGEMKKCAGLKNGPTCLRHDTYKG